MAEEVDRATKYSALRVLHHRLRRGERSPSGTPFAAHERGVQVRVLLDHIGSRKYPSYKKLVKMLNDSGMQWRPHAAAQTVETQVAATRPA